MPLNVKRHEILPISIFIAQKMFLRFELFRGFSPAQVNTIEMKTKRKSLSHWTARVGRSSSLSRLSK